MSRTILRAAISTALAALLLSGCLVGPKYQKPPAMTQAPPAAYKESPGAAQPGERDGRRRGASQRGCEPNTAATGTTGAQAADAGGVEGGPAAGRDAEGQVVGDLQDDELNALEEKLAIDNQTIKQYFANFMEARTLVAEARSQLYPTVGTGPSTARSQASANAGARHASGKRRADRPDARCRWMRRGSRTCGDGCATRSGPSSTTRR